MLSVLQARLDQHPGVLDVILTNEVGMLSNLEIMSPLGKSDHEVLVLSFYLHWYARTEVIYSIVEKLSQRRLLDLQLWKKIAKKHRLWTRYIETRDQNILSQYKSMQNTVRRETRKLHRLQQSPIASQCKTRSSADADNGLNAFSGQSRSTNMVPFHMLHIVSYCAIVTLSLRHAVSTIFVFKKIS